MNDKQVLEHLKDGILQFQRDVHAKSAELYEYAAAYPQKPHSLIIACADSRVDVEALTTSKPGEVFVARNVGNMVPAYGEMLGGVSAVIEYAVTALQVRHIAICGHSDCGAMKALLNPMSTANMPTLTSWLRNGSAALSIAETLIPGSSEPKECLQVLTEENVLMQIAHLKTHPSVAGALARARISLSGWVYDIGTGDVRIAEDGVRPFVSVRGHDETSRGQQRVTSSAG